MLTEEQVEQLVDKYLIGIYQNMEKDVIQDIARRVRKTERLTETAELMAKSMAEQGFSTDQILAEVMRTLRADPEYRALVAENTRAYKQMVTDEIKATVAEAKAAGNKLVAEAGQMAYNNDLSMWEQAGQTLPPSSQLSQIVGSFQRDLNGQLRNLTRTMGFKGTQLGTTGVLQAYQKTLDTALIETATGTFSFDEACNRAVKQLAQSGLRTIDYASGRSYQLDSAVRMNVRTSMNQMAGRITESNARRTGVDLVIVSQHEGARPSHADVENKIFSLSGASRNYPAFSDPLPVEGGEGAGYGTAGGICGVYCRHSFFPFWEGISEIPAKKQEPAPVNVGGKIYDYYQATQKQRSMERDIRALKREAYASQDPEEKKEIRRKISAKTTQYRQFSAAVDIRPKENRLRVVS